MRRLSANHLAPFEFRTTPLEQQLAAQWASINANWGLLEYALYLVLADVRPDDAHEWTLHFFGRDVGREKLVTDELKLLTKNDQAMLAALESGLSAIKAAKDIRNPLIHGRWYREGDVIKVQPLRLDRVSEFSIDQEIVVTPMQLRTLVDHMARAHQWLSSVGSETLASRALRKTEVRRGASVRGDIDDEDPQASSHE